MNTKLTSTLAAALMMGVFAGGAQAAICTATSSITDPDATLTHATDCGEGVVNTNNDSASLLTSIGGVLAGEWFELDKDESTGSATTGPLLSTGVEGTGASSSGYWAFDDLPDYNKYVIVIKDGKVPDGSTDPNISWFWFLVDTAAGCYAPTGSPYGSQDYCGTWTMYGNNGTIKDISHMTLYGQKGGDTPGNGQIPEPSMLGLLGVGLLGQAWLLRRRRQQQK